MQCAVRDDTRVVTHTYSSIQTHMQGYTYIQGYTYQYRVTHHIESHNHTPYISMTATHMLRCWCNGPDHTHRIDNTKVQSADTNV